VTSREIEVDVKDGDIMGLDMQLTSYLPWTDRAGNTSLLKLVVFCLALLPALITLQAAMTGGLGPRPVNAAILKSGDHAVWLLLASLAVTPLRRIGNWPRLILVRRMLGLFVLFYAALHLLLFVVEKNYGLWVVASEIVLRFYLTIGFAALLGLVLLGVTSNEAAIRRLGAARWNQLHSIVYGLGILVLLHFFLQSKADVSKSIWAMGLFALLMGMRGLHRYKLPMTAPSLLALGILCTLATASLEAGYYAWKTGANWLMVLESNLEFGPALRPASIVALAGLALVAVKQARGDRMRSGLETAPVCQSV
jgi:methionine sulfoxide reductase heme-binding subunit